MTIEFTLRHPNYKYKKYKITIVDENTAIITGPKDKSIKVAAFKEVDRLYKILTKYDDKIENDNVKALFKQGY